MSEPNPKVDAFLARQKRWQEEMAELRQIALSCPLTEELKWGHPCYTWEGKNVALVHGFKEYCAYLFFKGALLSDPRGVLIRQTENVQAARQIRFTSARDIVKLKPVLQTYLREAIAIEQAGRKVELKKASELALPSEFADRLDGWPALRSAFAALTPGRQRGYLLHFGAPKQSKTRTARIEKHVPRILQGKGLDD